MFATGYRDGSFRIWTAPNPVFSSRTSSSKHHKLASIMPPSAAPAVVEEVAETDGLNEVPMGSSGGGESVDNSPVRRIDGLNSSPEQRTIAFADDAVSLEEASQ